MKFELEEFHRNITDKELIADIQRVATELKQNSVTTRQQNEMGKFHSNTFMARFGNWYGVLKKAGLQETEQKNIPIEELFRNLEEVWIKLGRQPKFRDMQTQISRCSAFPYMRSFGSWRKALGKFVEYVNNEENISSEEAIKKLEIEPTMRHKTSRNINWRLRFIVMRRDNFKCKGCGRSPATDPTIILHVDHKTAWANGGETVLENLETLCSKCNIGKSNLE